MRRLVWKEIREKRFWITALAISVAGLLLLGLSYTYQANLLRISPWSAVPSFIALILGLGTYSGDLSQANFLYSRAVSWKKLLFAKLIVGIGTILLVAAMGAIIYRFMAPDAYIRLLTPAFLLKGIGMAVIVMAMPYILGMLCSMILPGIIGSVLVLAGLASIWAGNLWLISRFFTDDRGMSPIMPWTAIGWSLGILVAGVMIARFGLTLSIAQRMRRYFLAATLIGIALSSLDIFAPIDISIKPIGYPTNIYSISPDGEYYFEGRGRYATHTADLTYIPTAAYIVRTSDMKAIKLPLSKNNLYNFAWPMWAGEHNEILYSASPYAGKVMELIHLDSFNKLHISEVSLGTTPLYSSSSTSPSGRIIAVITKENLLKPHKAKETILPKPQNEYILYVEFVDAIQNRKLDTRVRINNWHRSWWESDNVFVVIDKYGHQQKIEVTR